MRLRKEKEVSHFPCQLKIIKLLKEALLVLRTANVQRSVDWDDLIYVPKFYVKNESKLLRPYDIFISTANSRELVGKVSFIDYLPIESTLGGFISAIRAFDVIGPKFLFYYLRMDTVQKMLKVA